MFQPKRVSLIFVVCLLASCSSIELDVTALATSASAEGLELFMPDAEYVQEEEDFTKDPMYDTIPEAFEAEEGEMAKPGKKKVKVRTHTFSTKT